MSNHQQWVPLNERNHLSTIHMCGIASGTIVNHVLWTTIFILFEPLSDRLKLTHLVRSLILLYGALAGFILAPIIGAYSDSLAFKWGRRRIFIVIGGLILTSGFVLLIFCEDIGHFFQSKNDTVVKALFIVSLFISFTGVNIAQLPSRTLCFELVGKQQTQQMANVVQVYEGLGGILINLIGGLFRTKFSSEIFLLVVCLLIILISYTITIVVAREEPLDKKDKKSFDNPLVNFWNAFRNMPKPFISIIPPFFFAYMAIYQFQFQFTNFMISLYSDNDIKDNIFRDGISFAMVCQLVNSVFQMIYGFLNTKVTEKIGIKINLVLGLFLLSLGLLLFYFVKNRYAYLAIPIPIGVGSLIFNSVTNTVVTLIVPKNELGSYFGMMNSFCVLGQQISNFGIRYLVDYLYKEDIPKHLISISSIPAIIGMIFAAFMKTPKNIGSNYQEISESQSNEIHNIDQLHE